MQSTLKSKVWALPSRMSTAHRMLPALSDQSCRGNFLRSQLLRGLQTPNRHHCPMFTQAADSLHPRLSAADAR